MRDAYIVTSVRTPGCKRSKGAFKDTRPEDMLSFILSAAVEKTENLEKKNLDGHRRQPRSRSGPLAPPHAQDDKAEEDARQHQVAQHVGPAAEPAVGEGDRQDRQQAEQTR